MSIFKDYDSEIVCRPCMYKSSGYVCIAFAAWLSRMKRLHWQYTLLCLFQLLRVKLLLSRKKSGFHWLRISK